MTVYNITYDHLQWSSILCLLTISIIYFILGYQFENLINGVFYYGIAVGIIQCLIIHECGLFITKCFLNCEPLYWNCLVEYIQMVPYRYIYHSGSDTDDDGENEKED